MYGPGIFMLDHPLGRLARLTAAGEEREIPILPDQDSYTCIHDLLTALQFVLTRCPAGKVFHVTGLDSDATAGEMALILHRNFPELWPPEPGMPGSGGEQGDSAEHPASSPLRL